ncbi:hypothetical protein Nmel_008035 [Mimus melanotis]
MWNSHLKKKKSECTKSSSRFSGRADCRRKSRVATATHNLFQ